jgi:hypothetical protein
MNVATGCGPLRQPGSHINLPQQFGGEVGE